MEENPSSYLKSNQMSRYPTVCLARLTLCWEQWNNYVNFKMPLKTARFPFQFSNEGENDLAKHLSSCLKGSSSSEDNDRRPAWLEEITVIAAQILNNL